jgi:hypothetical protein
MVKKLFRFFFLSIVFSCGAVIGGIYTPEIASYAEAENQQDKEKQQGIKPSKKKPSKKQRVARLSPDGYYA